MEYFKLWVREAGTLRHIGLTYQLMIPHVGATIMYDGCFFTVVEVIHDFDNAENEREVQVLVRCK